MPKRIQRKRTKGWRMPEGAVFVGRPTKWGNPFVVGDFYRTRGSAVAAYRAAFAGSNHPPFDQLEELRGKDLVCWCPLYTPCHAYVLLEWANAGGDA